MSDSSPLKNLTGDGEFVDVDFTVVSQDSVEITMWRLMVKLSASFPHFYSESLENRCQST